MESTADVAAKQECPSDQQPANGTKRKLAKNQHHTIKRCKLIKSKLELMALPDDCLNTIMRNLDMDQLNAMACTCTRLQALTGPVFKLKPTSDQLNIPNKLKALQKHSNDHETPAIILKQYLRNFGHLISSVEFDRGLLPQPFDHLADQLFTFIVVYCIGVLKSLKLHRMHLNAKAIDSAYLLFLHLKTLRIDNHLSLADVLPMCTNLEELYVDCNGGGAPIDLDNYNFANLRVFQLHAQCREGGLNAMALNIFIERHPDLEKISLNTPIPFGIDLDRIGQLNNLETLELYKGSGAANGQTIDLSRLADLFKLKAIATNYPICNLTEFLTKSKSNETLERLLTTTKIVVMNKVFIDGFSRFHNMQFVEFAIEQIPFMPEQFWQPLEKLKKIAEMRLICTSDNVTNFLKYLGSMDSLRKFKIDNFVASNELFRAINRYHGLGLLTLTQSVGLNNGHFKLLDNLKNVTEFQLRTPYAANDLGHDGIVNIATNLTALRVMKLFDSPSMIFMSNRTRNAVAHIYKENSREMVTRFDPRQKYCIVHFELDDM